MNEKDENPKSELFGRLLLFVLNKWVLVPLLAAVAGGGGWVLADVGAKPVDADTAKHIADSTTKAQLAPIKAEVEKIRDENRAAFGALMDAIPAFKKAVEARGQATAEADHKKAETDKLMDGLTGGSSK